MIVIRKSCKIRGQQRWLMELGNQRLNSQRPQKSCVQACVPVTPEFRDKDKDRQPSRNPMLPGLSQGNKGESWGRIPTSSFSLHVSEVGTCIYMPHTYTTHINHLYHTHITTLNSLSNLSLLIHSVRIHSHQKCEVLKLETEPCITFQ